MGFKWVHDFKKTLEHQSITEVAATENMMTRMQIMRHFGLTLADFKTQQLAFDFVAKELARNKVEFEHDGAAEPSDDGVFHDRFNFIVGHGKTRTWRQAESKQLQGSASCNSMESLKEAKAFMECLGPASETASSTTAACGKKNVSDEEKVLNINLAENRQIVNGIHKRCMAYVIIHQMHARGGSHADSGGMYHSYMHNNHVDSG